MRKNPRCSLMICRLRQAGLNPGEIARRRSVLRFIGCSNAQARLQAQVLLEPACFYGAGPSCRTTVSDRARLIVELVRRCR